MTIFVVSGIHRSGTSMIMNMLLEGGIEILHDNQYAADEWNPNGYFEWHLVKHNIQEPEILLNADGKAVKCTATTIMLERERALVPQKDYKVIWMNRDHREIIRSWERKNGRPEYPDNFEDKLLEHQAKKFWALGWLLSQKNMKVIEINYKDVLYHPKRELLKIREFLGVKLNIKKAKKVVNKKLYRIRE